METKLLNDEKVFPDEVILRGVLGPSYSAFDKLAERISHDDFGIALEWRYYRDGKSWLGKAVHKKKTVFWLGVREKAFSVTFYFTEKTAEGVLELDIGREIKDGFKNSHAVGKLLPLTVVVSSGAQNADVLKLAGYKIKS